jgi:hypothetical protein
VIDEEFLAFAQPDIGEQEIDAMALEALRIGSGDEVLAPTWTFRY